ncbi:hypothetical protein P8C59_007776 [Phyllachora maydis]|uniref:ERCC1-like central domain-containing protein n=1 Tax=Phyllachora maydis TaxID=1825666 RepID=A0AAD9IAW7_9PEZI|nr:hypothetical protein P8C59_007776 [Phyllachora maydis]
MEDDFSADDDLLAALAASDARSANRAPPSRPKQPPARVQQPTPQRLDKAPPSNSHSNSSGPQVVQPTPQALPARSAGSTILVSPRQKGNPVLASLKSMPWEYSDIPADYGLGLTTCALFLSLKYHRLHPEYIYTRIRNLQGKYNLRILLTMVDIPHHEDALRELSKTSLVNNVTVILCWSAAEAARYLELYKSYEHANFGAIRGQQASGYAEKLVEFITVPRSVNKADAIALVSTFGSLRNAVNADPDQIAVISGWGEKKVKSWCKAVDEPFRVKKAGKRRVGVAQAVGDLGMPGGTQPCSLSRAKMTVLNAMPISGVPSRDVPARTEGGEEAMLDAAITASTETAQQGVGAGREQLSDGVAGALAMLRNSGQS